MRDFVYHDAYSHTSAFKYMYVRTIHLICVEVSPIQRATVIPARVRNDGGKDWTEYALLNL